MAAEETPSAAPTPPPPAQPAAPPGASPPPPAPTTPPVASEPKPAAEQSLYALAEEGWRELIAAASKIQSAANKIKRTERSIDGYGIERALMKHRPALMPEHLKGLQEHMKDIKT